MRILTEKTKSAVRAVMAEHAAELDGISGFISAEPGFPVVNGTVLREPAIIVFVAQKKPPGHLLEEERAPRQIGRYRVCVLQADPMMQLLATSEHQALAETMTMDEGGLTYEPLSGNPIDKTFKIEQPMLCHVGPDAGWPVLKPFLEATRKTLTVAMYDFNAEYIAKTFIDTVRANELDVVLTWDDSMNSAETEIRTKIRERLSGQLSGWIVRCGADRRFASAYHEKVAVRDSEAFWLSSGNWSTRSQPDIDPIGKPATARGMFGRGNREWHIIVEDRPLAKLFETYILHDRDGSKAEAEAGETGMVLDETEPLDLPDVFVPLEALVGDFELEVTEPARPAALPAHGKPVTVRPLLSPDNYVERIIELLRSAKRSVYLQFSYITYSARPKDKTFRDMLDVLAELSFRPGMDVRIIVGSGDATDKIRRLVEVGFNEAVFRRQGGVHNKGIIVDGEAVLVCSANWSSDGVLRNRDAGLIIYDPEIAGYYGDVFLDDWERRASPYLGDDTPAIVATSDQPTPPGMVRMSWREYFE